MSMSGPAITSVTVLDRNTLRVVFDDPVLTIVSAAAESDNAPSAYMLSYVELSPTVFIFTMTHLYPSSAYDLNVTFTYSGGDGFDDFPFTTTADLHDANGQLVANPGAWPATGPYTDLQGLWYAVAHELEYIGGHRVAKLRSDFKPYDPYVHVRSTAYWPPRGRFDLGPLDIVYLAKTPTVFTDLRVRFRTNTIPAKSICKLNERALPPDGKLYDPKYDRTWFGPGASLANRRRVNFVFDLENADVQEVGP